MIIYPITSLIAFFTCSFLGIFVYLKRRKDPSGKRLGILSLLAGVWCLFPTVTYFAKNQLQALLFVRLVYLFAIFAPSLVADFLVTFSVEKKGNFTKKFIKFFYLISLIFLFILFYPIFIKGVINLGSHFTIIPGPLFFLFILFFTIVILYGLIINIKNYKKANGYRKNQLKYIFIAFFIATIGGMMHFLPIYTKTPEIFPHDFLLIIFVSLLSYTIIRYRLMDINIIIRKSIIYSFLSIFVLSIFVLIIFLGQHLFQNVIKNSLITSSIAALIIALGFQPIQKFFTKITDKFFFKKKYDFEKTLLYLSREIPTLLNFDQIMKLVSSTLIETIRIKSVSLFTLDEGKGGFRGLLEGKEIFLNFDNAFIKNLIKNKDFIVKEELEIEFFRNDKNGLEKEKIIKILKGYGISLVLPLIIKQRITGFLALGEKLSGDPFFQQDLNLLSNLSSQVGISIENSRLYKNLTVEKNNLNSIIRGFTDALIVCDDKKNIIYLNPAAEKVFDLKLDESKEIKRESLEFPYLNKIFEAIEIGQEKVNLRSKDGEEEDFQLSKVLLKQESGSFNNLIILHRID